MNINLSLSVLSAGNGLILWRYEGSDKVIFSRFILISFFWFSLSVKQNIV